MQVRTSTEEQEGGEVEIGLQVVLSPFKYRWCVYSVVTKFDLIYLFIYFACFGDEAVMIKMKEKLEKLVIPLKGYSY